MAAVVVSDELLSQQWKLISKTWLGWLGDQQWNPTALRGLALHRVRVRVPVDATLRRSRRWVCGM